MNKIAKFSGDNSGDGDVTKILGSYWDTKVYTFAACSIPNPNLEAQTKRQVISELSKPYDPLGIVLPLTIRGSILIQKIWKTGCKWDDRIDMELLSEYRRIALDYVSLHDIELDLGLEIANGTSLYIFCDASIQAYAAVVYLSIGTKLQYVLGKA